jgi:hypothetical protein
MYEAYSIRRKYVRYAKIRIHRENIMGSKLTKGTYILRFIVLSLWLHSKQTFPVVVASKPHNMAPTAYGWWWLWLVTLLLCWWFHQIYHLLTIKGHAFHLWASHV